MRDFLENILMLFYMARDPRAIFLLHSMWNLRCVIYLLSAEQIRIVLVLQTSVEKTIVAWSRQTHPVDRHKT
jgi:hypothetical protein